MIALFVVWARHVACFIVTCFLALPLAHADPAASAAGAFSKEIEGHLWRIDSIEIKRSIRHFPYTSIWPAGDDGSDAYIMFENGDISGSLGCGQLAGRYSLSDDRVQIPTLSTNERRRCGPEFLYRAAEVISALKDAVRIERRAEDVFYLFDEQKTYSIRLELLSPGFDFSEVRASFWKLVSLEGNSIAEPNVEMRLDEGRIQLSVGKLRADFSYSYRSGKFAVRGPVSAARLGESVIPFPPLFETFGQVLQRIARYTASGDELTATDASGQHVMLLRQIHPAGLEYRYWHIAKYGLGGWLNSTTSSPQFMSITFVRGELDGSASCTGFEGDYSLSGESVSVQAYSYSLVGGCSVEGQNEQRIVEYALNKASRVKEDGARMLLKDTQGNTTIVLVPYAQQTAH